MMRLARICAVACLAQPVAAWEFTSGTPCLLAHEASHVSVELTYDPTVPVYTISVSRTKPFPVAASFAIQFGGQIPLTIATDRHQYSNNARTITVTDSGFGNVLNGLQFGSAATALIADEAIPIPLTGAAPAVAAFRVCDAQPTA